MQQLLRSGQVVHTMSGRMDCTVRTFLGGGTQGEVYVAELGSAKVALKWYLPQYLRIDPHLDRRIETAIKRGAPTDKFLWPLDVTVAVDVSGFGYVMPLREPRFKGLVDLMRGDLDPSFRALATTCFYLADSFGQLHAKGLCYRDINFGNVFFDPSDGDIRICDNDNVDVESEPTSIGGTQRFMAPEIVRGEALPNRESDYFSLAVLLFYMLMMHHPLEGKLEYDIHSFDNAAMKKLYGTSPLFVFNPMDPRNAPVPGYHDTVLKYWPIYPRFLRDLFTKAFTEGLVPGKRVIETEWRRAMINLRDSIFYCGGCRADNFYDLDAAKSSGGSSHQCWRCGKEVALPPRVRINSRIIILNHDTQLFPHHVDDSRKFDFTQPVAAMVQHPTNPSLWGLKNMGSAPWVATLPDSSQKHVEPGRSVQLTRGIKINFGKSEGEIRT